MCHNVEYRTEVGLDLGLDLARLGGLAMTDPWCSVVTPMSHSGQHCRTNETQGVVETFSRVLFFTSSPSSLPAHAYQMDSITAEALLSGQYEDAKDVLTLLNEMGKQTKTSRRRRGYARLHGQ